ncbi:MAG: SusC/RagA family TonB-linked outer membrane protein [Chitinophagaceae bacterium]|nr:MAG: SusC/RagA family TonB-linked outer membrane protein [Chitinophagaceae bacterium]
MHLNVTGKVMPRLVPLPRQHRRNLSSSLFKRPAQKMKLLITLMVCVILFTGLSAHAGHRPQQVTASFKNASLEEVFREIKKQTGYSFVYTKSMLARATRATFTVSNVSINTALDACFREQPFEYNIIEKAIIIKLRRLPETPQVSIATVAPIPVRGTITDGKGQALEGVSVQVKGGKGISTDKDGNFFLPDVDGNAVLVISYVGFKTVEIPVNNRTTINVNLEETDQKLGEVVVVGYGTQKKKLVSGSIASIKSSAIENLPVASLDRAMQGQAAGVQVNANNGIPGGATEVRIRGIGSVNAGNQPLYIIDGVQISPEPRSRNVASSNPLSGINSNDIESIDILKDAAAASIYGAQAGNGVIIITTKKGKAGKPRVNFNSSVGFTELIKKPDLVDGKTWVALRREAAVNSGDLTGPYSVDQTYGAADTAKSYDWIDAVTRKGLLQNYELSLSGGNDRTRYFIAGSHSDQKYHFIGYDYKRSTFRVNLETKLNDKLTLETKVNLSSVKQNSSDNPSFGTTNVFVDAMGVIPTNPIYNADGTYNTNIYGVLSGSVNPPFFVSVNKNQGITAQAIGNLALTYNITNDLTFKSSYSLEYTTINEELFFDPRTRAGQGTNGLVRFGQSKVVNWQTDQTLNYNHTFGERHAVTALVGVNYRNETFTTTNTQGTGVAIPQLGGTLSGTTPNVVGSTFSEYRMAGAFARLGYVLDDKYIFQAVVRRDGSSRFGTNNRYGYFPSLSAAWRIIDEKFLANASFLSDLKLRVSYGETGNSQFLMTNTGAGTGPVPVIESNYPGLSLFESSVAASYAASAGINFAQLGNSQLGWERNVTKNIGIDFGFFKNRISGTVDYFIRTTKDLLLSKPVPTTAGFTSIAQNIGSLENRGVEFGLTTINLTGDFKWTTNFNITFLKNEVLSLLEPGVDLPANNLWIGRPVGEVWVAHWAGVNPADGRPMWYDASNNITYNPVQADRAFRSGNSLIPDYYGGFTNTFSFKNFELSAFFQYQVGTVQQNFYDLLLTSDFRYDAAQSYTSLERWTTPGQMAVVPRLYPGAIQPGTASSVLGGGYGGVASDRFYDDASYIRLKTISLGYTLPKNILAKTKLSNARVYVQAYNIWTGTNYTGLDPEYTSGGYGLGLAPQGKSYTAGIQVGF